MAQLISNFNFLGRLGNISAYKMKGSDKIIIRTRGGASKDKFRRDPRMARTRENATEFGGRARATRVLRTAMGELCKLADYNFAGQLNKLARTIQLMDESNARGQREIRFSRNPGAVEGFQLNRRLNFDSIVRNPIAITMNKADHSATVSIVELKNGFNLNVPNPLPAYFQLQCTLAIVPDLEYRDQGYRETGVNGIHIPACSEWYPVLSGSPPVTIDVKIPEKFIPSATGPFSLMLSVGIAFGAVEREGVIGILRNAGAAKIARMI